MHSAEAQRHQQKHKYKQKASAKQQLTQKQLDLKSLINVLATKIYISLNHNAFCARQVAEFRTRKITVRKRCGMTVVKFRTKI